MIQQRINSFLLPMIGASPDTYVEFDLTEKLKGDFEQRAAVIQSSVGGPWLTRNEARRDNNLPPIEGGDELIVPLNVVTGGQASPQDTHSNQMSRTVLCSCGKNHPKTKAEEEPEEISISGKVRRKSRTRSRICLMVSSSVRPRASSRSSEPRRIGGTRSAGTRNSRTIWSR
jgi:Phage portal protein.